MAEEYSIVYMYHSFLIHSSADGHGDGNHNPLQYSCLENSMDGGAWHVSPNLPIHSPFPPHRHVHMPILYLCVFIPALYSYL